MNYQDWDQVDRIIVECAEALFGACGVEASYAGPASEGTHTTGAVLAVIGFAGVQLRGSLVLNADLAVLTRSHPAGASVAELPDEDVRDWSAELANQLLGRIKNRLLSHSVVIQLSTPTTLSGLQLRVGPVTRQGQCRLHQFRAADAMFWVRFDAVAEADVQLVEPRRGDEAISPEGELVLF